MTLKTALVTGGNRGIGLETARQLAGHGLHVFLGTRDLAAGEDAALSLLADGLNVRAVPCDVADNDSVEGCAHIIAEMGHSVDVLVNNAGVVNRAGVLSTSWNEWRSVFETNFSGASRTTRVFLPGMIERGYGRIVNVSSGYGSFGEGLEGPPPYSTSKAALDALTLKTAQEIERSESGGVDIKVNACCPGWVRTRMGGASAARSVEDGADVVCWLATLDDDGPSGGFFRDRKRIPW